MSRCRIFDIGFEHRCANFDAFFSNCPDLVIVRLGDETLTASTVKSSAVKLAQQARKHPNKQIVCVTDQWYGTKFGNLLPDNFKKVVFTSIPMFYVFKKLVIDGASTIEKSWMHDNDKWLFLTGKLDKPNRLGFLHFLWQKKLLDKCTWSLRFYEDMIDAYLPFLPNFTYDQARKWLVDHSRSPDQAQFFQSPTQQQRHYGGIPYGQIYQHALFQVVSETHSHANPHQNILPWITEKTWLSIINKRPFMIFGQPGTYEWLKQWGFKTYEKFLLDLDFDKPIEMIDRFRSLGKNITHWLELLPLHAQEIHSITQQNCQRMLDLVQRDVKTLETFLTDHSLDTDIYSLVGSLDLQHNLEQAEWHNFYARVRDAHWPDCDNEQEFANLPGWIQRECIEVFGYRPRSDL